jgi:hypothetical protein
VRPHAEPSKRRLNVWSWIERRSPVPESERNRGRCAVHLTATRERLFRKSRGAVTVHRAPATSHRIPRLHLVTFLNCNARAQLSNRNKARLGRHINNDPSMKARQK